MCAGSCVDDSKLLNSFSFDAEGKTIDRLMLKSPQHHDDQYESLLQRNYAYYATGTMVRKATLNENGKMHSISGWVDNFDPSSGFYIIKYDNGDWEWMQEANVSKIVVT